MRKIFILLFFLALATQHSFAQQSVVLKKRFPVKDLGYENGLLDNNMSGVITDEEGFTWLSTFTGLQRFNGYNFEKINPVAGKDTFHINYSVYFFQLNNGRLWISIKEGILEYNPLTDVFKLVISFKKNDAAHFGILPLKQTGEGIWCMQQNKGIVLYDKQGALKKRFNFFPIDSINNILQTGEVLYDAVVAADDHMIYIDNVRNNILAINTSNHTAHVINTTQEKITSIACLYNKLYAVTTNSLIIINDTSEVTKHIALKTLADETITSSSLQPTNNNELLLSRNGHLYKIDSAGNILYEMVDKSKNIFIANGSIEKTYLDKFNRIWILSNDAVKRVQNSELLFEHLVYTNDQHNFIRALYYDDQKHILIAGGYNGALQLYDSMSNALWQQPLVTKLGLFILGIQKISKDDYLIVVYFKGLFVFNAATKQVHALSCASSSLEKLVSSFQMNYPNNLQRVNDSTILIATNNNIYKCIFNGDKLVSAQPISPVNMNGELDCFVMNSYNELWVGTNTGRLFKFVKGKTSEYEIQDNYMVRSIAEDKNNNILVGTERGLFVYNTNGKLLRAFYTASGLRNDCIYSIITTPDNYFVATNLGISSIAVDGTIHNYSKEMGLQENEFNTNASLKINNGKIFFGGINGITAFYPETLSQVKDSVLIHVTQLTVNDSSYNSSSGIWNRDSIKLNYDENRLRFDIAALGILNANEYVYQYRLKEIDTIWQTTYNPVNLNYTLQPGSYTLEIKCHPLLSSTQTFFKNVAIEITPPFWQTWLFRIVAAIVILGGIYFFIYNYSRKKYLAAISRLETQHQIQTERERISRELHDNIGSQLSFIISNIDWTIDSTESMTRHEEKQRLSSINATAKNVMSNLRESIWALNKEKITLEEFADKLKAYIQNIIALKPELEFISQENIVNNISFSPTETLNIFRICQEVINNVIKHASATVLKIQISSNEKFFIQIEDNGKGFDVSGAMNGFGLENIKYRAAELKLTLDVQSTPGAGTVVSIYK